MAYGSTITITINAVAKVLNRIADDGSSSEWMLRTSTEEFRVKIRHSHSDPKGAPALQRGVDRHNIDFTHTIFATPTTNMIVRHAFSTQEVYGSDDNAAALLDFVGFHDYARGTSFIQSQLDWLS